MATGRVESRASLENRSGKNAELAIRKVKNVRSMQTIEINDPEGVERARKKIERIEGGNGVLAAQSQNEKSRDGVAREEARSDSLSLCSVRANVDGVGIFSGSARKKSKEGQRRILLENGLRG